VAITEIGIPAAAILSHDRGIYEKPPIAAPMMDALARKAGVTQPMEKVFISCQRSQHQSCALA
jgi:hypothetical protein